jgi:D-sedoheptulose 7-phosphate isomerase
MDTYETVLKRKLQEIGSLFEDKRMVPQVDNATQGIANALINGKKLTAIGNGGSYANADHFIGELTGRFRYHRKPIAAFSLNGQSGFTAIGNDYGYENSYARQITCMLDEGDVLIAYSASGTSPNIIEAAKAAHEKGAIVVGFSGMTGSLKDISDFPVTVDSVEVQNIEEIHYLLMHIICEMVEDRWVRACDPNARAKDYVKKN